MPNTYIGFAVLWKDIQYKYMASGMKNEPKKIPMYEGPFSVSRTHASQRESIHALRHRLKRANQTKFETGRKIASEKVIL